jgi:hypothetical protein
VSAIHQPAAPTHDATHDQPAQRPPRYRGYRLDGPIQELHRAVDALERDSVPYAYYLKVLAGRDQPPVERARGGPER